MQTENQQPNEERRYTQRLFLLLWRRDASRL
jgi:hypothetical protein